MQGTHWACRVLLASFPVTFFSRTGRRAGTGDEARVLCSLERDCPLLGGDKCTITMGSGNFGDYNLSFVQRLSSFWREVSLYIIIIVMIIIIKLMLLKITTIGHTQHAGKGLAGRLYIMQVPVYSDHVHARLVPSACM